MNDSSIAQLHRTLVDALRRARPAGPNRPVTVAEIYQDLVPYKTARTVAGFAMNADYEHALLRLLAGEGDYARIEPSEVRDKLRMELESPNPDVSLYRDFAACDVWINVGDGLHDVAMDETEAEESWEDELTGAETPVDAQQIQAALGVLDRPPAPPFEIAAEPPAKPAPKQAPPPAQHTDHLLDAVACSYCGGELPDTRMVNFCPHCGTDQSQQPCPSCGEMLEPLWRFCVACGTRVRQLGDHVN
jgi:hypothetical protein